MPRQEINLVGQRFNRLVVLDETPRSYEGKRWWHCRCDCGGKIWATTGHLRDGSVQSCGCLQKENAVKTGSLFEDLTGMRFGRLTVIRPAAKQSKGTSKRWSCQCDCGKMVIASADILKTGGVQSCGCLKKEMSGKKLDKANKNNFVEDTKLNGLTSKVSKRSTTGVKGVYRDSERNMYVVYITFQKKRHYIGRFADLEDAAKARKEAEKKYFDPMLEKYGKEKTK